MFLLYNCILSIGHNTIFSQRFGTWKHGLYLAASELIWRLPRSIILIAVTPTIYVYHQNVIPKGEVVWLVVFVVFSGFISSDEPPQHNKATYKKKMYDPRLDVCTIYKMVIDTWYWVWTFKVNSQISTSLYHRLGECRWSENNRMSIADWQQRKQCN